MNFVRRSVLSLADDSRSRGYEYLYFGLMFDGLPGIFLDLAFQRAFTLISSRVLLDELDEKLLGKFPMTTANVRAVRAKLESTAQIVAPDFTLEVISADPDDNRVLECAVAGNAEFVISGDRHLLQLGSYEGISILTVRQFMDTIQSM